MKENKTNEKKVDGGYLMGEISQEEADAMVAEGVLTKEDSDE